MDQEMSAFDRYERGLVLKQVRMFLGFLFGKVECPRCFCWSGQKSSRSFLSSDTVSSPVRERDSDRAARFQCRSALHIRLAPFQIQQTFLL